MAEMLGAVALTALIGAAGGLLVMSVILAVAMAAEGDPLNDPLRDD